MRWIGVIIDLLIGFDQKSFSAVITFTLTGAVIGKFISNKLNLGNEDARFLKNQIEFIE